MVERSEAEVLDLLLLLDAPSIAPDLGTQIIHRAQQRRRVRRLMALAAGGAVASAIAAGVTLADRGPEPIARLAQSPSPSGPTRPVTVPVSAVTAIQAASIRELADRVGTGRSWPVLFILAERYDGVSLAPGAEREAGRISTPEQQALRSALADYAPVQFLSSRADAHTVGTLAVRDRGALVTLGRPPAPDGQNATFSLSVQVNGLNGQGLTFELSETSGRWSVVGTSGPMWIS